VAEILTLRWQEVDFEQKCLKLSDSKTGRKTVYLNTAAVQILAYIDRSDDNPAEGASVPIAWAAVGDPASFFPPAEHEKIWALQRPLNFPLTAYGMERLPDGGVDMVELTGHLADSSDAHRADRIVG
jgi:hypothetical protein